MNTATCPRCETIVEAEPSIATVCGVCGQEFTPAEHTELPTAQPVTAPAAPRRSWRWVGWLAVFLIAAVPVVLVLKAILRAVKQDGSQAVIESVTFLFSGIVGAVLMFCLVVWAILWITFPVFVYVLLRRILRAIEANTAARQPASRP